MSPEECPLQSFCQHEPDPGLCLAYIPSWFYNTTSRQCEEFIYGGCGGNDNRFCSKEECDHICQGQITCMWNNNTDAKIYVVRMDIQNIIAMSILHLHVSNLHNQSHMRMQAIMK